MAFAHAGHRRPAAAPATSRSRGHGDTATGAAVDTATFSSARAVARSADTAALAMSTSSLQMLGNRAMAALLSDAKLEREADRASAAMHSGVWGPRRSASPPAAVPVIRDANAGRGLVALGEQGGQPLAPEVRGEYEAQFGHDFSNVRVHAENAVSRRLDDAGMRALACGDDIAFGTRAYAPHTSAGGRLLAHELAHVVQQRGGMPAAAGRPGLSASRLAPQAQDDPTQLRRRLQAVRARLAALRAEREGLDGRFVGSLEAETQRRSLEQGTRDLHSDARADTAARTMMGGQFTSAWVRRVVSARRSGSTITLAIPFEIQYVALTDAAARRRSATDIPRLVAAIRDVWQVDIADGEYAGVQFQVVPSIAYLARTATRAQNAFLIEVRGVDTGPSQGLGHLGLISLAPAHLDGARTIVIAHELMHLFGFTDQYLHQVVTDRRGRQREQLVVVGAQDAAGRADPLGIIDPTLLSRALAERTITQQDVTRQTTNVRIWQEHASEVLSALGVLPPPPRRPTVDDEEFDPSEELRRIEREGEARLAPIRERRSRAENSLRWIQIAEETMRLEQEEQALQTRIDAASRP
jgi:hypothetical protein